MVSALPVKLWRQRKKTVYYEDSFYDTVKSTISETFLSMIQHMLQPVVWYIKEKRNTIFYTCYQVTVIYAIKSYTKDPKSL